ncbi:MAG: DUF805 domain-containing protein [Bacteroides sp.]|nr:DUF805 domain-containing protein [Bacteroides sp.]
MYQYRVSFEEAISRAFSNYCKFTGRASRSEYWWFALLNELLYLLIQFMGFVGGFDYTTCDVLGIIVGLPLFLPSLGLLFRRLHDTGHSGWNWLWFLLPVIGWIIILVYLVKASEMTENQYGPVPNLTVES